jgi:hypothetical protein
MARPPGQAGKRGALHSLSLTCLLLACSDRAAHKPEHAPEPATTHLFLREDFPLLDGVHCRVDEAELLLSEPQSHADALVEDVLVAKLVLGCQDERGRALSSAAALPEQAQLALLVRGAQHAATLRTRANLAAPEALIFELHGADDVLQKARRFSTTTGLPVAAYEHSVGTLQVTLGQRRVAVALRERAADAELDAALARVARALSGAAPLTGDLQALERARELFIRGMERFAPRELALSSLAPDAGGLHVTLSLTRSPVADAPEPVASFELAFTRDTSGRLTLESLVEPERTAEAIACADALHALRGEVERAFQQHPSNTPCNALGVLLPGPCQETDATLLTHVLDTRTRCALPHADGQAKLGDDFQLTIRRGKHSSGLDHDPRYVLALFGTGQVVFHGRHWVSAMGRSDGRTSERALSALYQRFLDSDWFERKGGVWSADGCNPEDDVGNVITLHAHDRERMVVDRDGCRGPFSARELGALAEAMDRTAGVAAWTTPRPRYVDPGVEIWSISDD